MVLTLIARRWLSNLSCCYANRLFVDALQLGKNMVNIVYFGCHQLEECYVLILLLKQMNWTPMFVTCWKCPDLLLVPESPLPQKLFIYLYSFELYNSTSRDANSKWLRQLLWWLLWNVSSLLLFVLWIAMSVFQLLMHCCAVENVLSS